MRLLLPAAAIGLLTAPGPVWAGECVALNPSSRPTAAATIGLFPSADLPRAVVRRAVGAWSSCSRTPGDMPRLVVGEAGTRDLLVRFRAEAVGSDGRCGTFSGRTITLYGRTRSAGGQVRSCGSLAQNLTHELGHAFGLADAPASCDTFAMAKLNPSNRYHRRVQPGECELLRERWDNALLGSNRADLGVPALSRGPRREPSPRP